MSTTSTRVSQADATSRATITLYAGAAVGAVAAIVLAVVMLFATTTDEGAYQHAADYVVTVVGYPYMLGALAVISAVHVLHRGRDGKLGRIGLIVTGVGLVALLIPLTASLVVGADQSVGPVYMLATLATFAGMILFAAGLFRARVLPRWIPPVWAIAWIIGGPLALSGLSLLLAAIYLVIAVLLPARAER